QNQTQSCDYEQSTTNLFELIESLRVASSGSRSVARARFSSGLSSTPRVYVGHDDPRGSRDANYPASVEFHGGGRGVPVRRCLFSTLVAGFFCAAGGAVDQRRCFGCNALRFQPVWIHVDLGRLRPVYVDRADRHVAARPRVGGACNDGGDWLKRDVLLSL